MDYSKIVNKKSSGSFVGKIIKEKALVYDLRFPETDNAFFIIEVEKLKHKEFKRVLKENLSISLTDYGKILFSGYGEPSLEIRNILKEKYDFE